MPGEHAVLSPSSAERWIECPASVQLSRRIPPGPESPYAHEGTVAHELAFLKASRRFGKITPERYNQLRSRWRRESSDLLDRDEVEVEMERHTDAYVDLLDREMARHHNSQLLLEQRVDSGVPECWGTADALIISPVHVCAIDLKYGQGVIVDAVGNSQARLYALGGMDNYGDMLGETEEIRIIIFQPRADNVSEEVITPDELRAWREEVVVPAAEEALGPDPHFSPSEAACRWCPAAGRCQAQLEWIFSEPFDDPDLMSPEEVAFTKRRIPQIRDWINAFEEAALRMAYSEGRSIPGYKVVLSGGKRAIINEAEAIRHLIDEHGYSADEVARLKIRTMGDLEALMGKDKFATVLQDYIRPPVGSPALVPNSDTRSAVAPNTEAAKTFGMDLL